MSLDKTIEFTDLQNFIQTGVLDTLPEYYRQVVAFTGKVVEDANAVEDADFEALMDEGFSTEEICEIIAAIDLATMFNVYTSALKLDLDPQYRAIL